MVNRVIVVVIIIIVINDCRLALMVNVILVVLRATSGQ